MGAQATQQDGAEFLCHLMDLPESSALGCRQARLLPDTADMEPVRNTGSGIHYLSIPPGATTCRVVLVSGTHNMTLLFARMRLSKPHQCSLFASGIALGKMLPILNSISRAPFASPHEAVPGSGRCYAPWRDRQNRALPGLHGLYAESTIDGVAFTFFGTGVVVH